VIEKIVEGRLAVLRRGMPPQSAVHQGKHHHDPTSLIKARITKTQENIVDRPIRPFQGGENRPPRPLNPKPKEGREAVNAMPRHERILPALR
jgi:hypothetical protein